MAEWVNVGPASEIPPGTHRVVDVADVMIAVFNVDGKFYAIEDVCPRHGATFDIRSGEALAAPAYEPTATFPVRVENGIVQVKDERWD